MRMAPILAGGSSSPIDSSAEVKTVREFPRAVREIENVWIPLSDGCRLAARVWLPEDAERDPVPAILEYLPYRKRDFTATRDELTHTYLAGHGYACIRVDLRGSGDSDGLLLGEYLKQEQDDGLEVIDWIVRQTWSTGAVGIIGISWGGFNGLQIAARRPPALKAIITVCSTDDRYADDVHYIGGALLQNNLTWGSTMLAYMTRSPDPVLVGERWREMWFERLSNLPLFAAQWLGHQYRDDFWKHGSVCEDFSDITCAVYAVGGWTDGYPNSIPRLVAGLKGARKGLIGPWGHRLPHFATPGPQIGFLQEAIRWWDKWLKGIETGIMAEPMMRAWMQESVRPATWYHDRPGRWVGEAMWPSESIEMRTLHLTANGLSTLPGAETAMLVSSPETVGKFSGMWSVHGVTPDEPFDQREEDGKSLVFDSAPLSERVEILGATVLDLEVASDKPIAKLVVRLCDVHPDGASTRVSYGILNLTHRDSHEFPSALEPGRRYRVRVRLKETGYAFPPGHRLRISLSTTYWPMTWPTPERAALTVFAGGAFVTLPERKPRPEDRDLQAFKPSESAPPRPTTMLRPGRFERTITRDMSSGATRSVMFDDYGVSRLESNGIEIASSRRHEFSIDEEDPLSARAEIQWSIEIGRGEWRTRSVVRVVQTATRDAFHIHAEMDAFEGNSRIMSRNWDCAVPRDLV
jgi:putative CocE/NonD family hydrolase